MRLAILFFLLTPATWADPAAWHVRTDSADIWLLGSVHYLHEQDHPLPNIVDDLYRLADINKDAYRSRIARGKHD